MKVIKKLPSGKSRIWDVNEQWVRENKAWMKANDFQVMHIATIPPVPAAEVQLQQEEIQAEDAGEYAPVEVTKVETKKVQKTKQK